MQRVRASLGGFDTAGSHPASPIPAEKMSPSTLHKVSAPRTYPLSVLNSHGYTHPCQRLTAILTDDSP